METRAALIALLTAAACSTGVGPKTPDLPSNHEVDLHPRLAAYTDCDELERSIEDAQILRMRSWLEEARLDRFVSGTLSPGPSAPPPTAGPSAFTSTNTQVEGVAEADVVQNDGTRIAALAGGSLHLLRSWPAAALAEASALAIEGSPHDLFLTADRVVVFSAVYRFAGSEALQPRCGPEVLAEGAGALAMPPDAYCGPVIREVKLTAVDVSELSAPRVVAELYLPGDYVSARLVGERIRLVTREGLDFPEGVALWPAFSTRPSRAERSAAFAELAVENEARIRGARLEDWVRPGKLRVAGQEDEVIAWTCTGFRHGAGVEPPGLFSVVTVDLATLRPVDRTSGFADASTVYASAHTLYVASPHWYWWPEPGQRSATYLHAFDISDPDRAAYVASGVVDGRLLDPYALDERGELLRVATTTEERARDGALRTASRVSVLAPEDGELRLVGRTAEFGAGEQVFATRFLGTRGFVVTAAQIDPLFAVDLADPTAPAVVGELELPGFVSYLHPVDEAHLLGIGRDGAANGGPAPLKAALFDVSDLTRPRELSRIVIGEASTWGWSDALQDPHAFTWFADRALLAIPYVTWTGDSLASDLRLFHVDAGQGIAPAGILPMSDVYAGGPDAELWYGSPAVTRSILADDFVYAVSDAGIRSAHVPDLPGWLATVVFPRQEIP
jgi:hypothetical protein